MSPAARVPPPMEETSSPDGADGQDRERAQTATIGIVLVFGMVIAGAALVVGLGAVAIDDTQSRLTEQRAQKIMTQFDSKSALVALQNAQTQQMEFPRRADEQVTVEEGDGELTIEIDSLSGGSSRSKTWVLGKMVYASDNLELAYQGGGVWRNVDDGRESVMVSPPEFHFRNGTLTFPIITLEGDSSIGDRVGVSHGASPDTWYPDTANGWANPLDDHKVTVTVRSEYYKGWGQYFEARTDGKVSYDHSNDEVSLELVTPLGRATVSQGLAGLSAGDLTISGKAGDTCSGPYTQTVYVDSYDSSQSTNDYCGQAQAGTLSEVGNLSYGGDITLGGSGGSRDLKGSIKAGGRIDLNNDKWNIWEDIYYTDDCDVNGGANSGPCDSAGTESAILPDHPVDEVHQIPGIDTMPVLTGVIQSKVTTLSNPANNDNDAEGDIVGSQLDLSGAGDSVTLTGGNAYFLENIHLQEQTLNLDVCSGSITIAVRGDVELRRSGSSGSTINVDDAGCDNSNTVKVYVLGDAGSSDGDALEFFLSRASKVSVPRDDAPQFRIYGTETFESEIGESGGSKRARFTGVIYAPVGTATPDDGFVNIHKAGVFGGIVTGDTTMDTKATLHYDKALKNKQIISRSSKVVKVTYLHASENKIIIGD